MEERDAFILPFSSAFFNPFALGAPIIGARVALFFSFSFLVVHALMVDNVVPIRGLRFKSFGTFTVPRVRQPADRSPRWRNGYRRFINLQKCK